MVAPKNTRIFQEIEATAGFYGPSLYTTLGNEAQGLLTHFHDQTVFPDPDGVFYFPMTSVKYDPKETKLFAVGVIPPSADVTGRILDRSATIAVNMKEDEEVAAAESGSPSVQREKEDEKKAEGGASDEIVGDGGGRKPLHQWARGILIEAFEKVMGRPPTLAEIQYLQAVAWLETRYGTGWKGDMKGSFNWGAVQCPKNAQNSPNCIPHEDSYENRQKYKVAFRKYDSHVDGAMDVVKNVFIYRGRTAKSLGEDPSCYNASYAMRRETYYGGWCDKASRKYGSQQVLGSLRNPDGTEAQRACAQEAISSHATLVHDLIRQQIAGACGDDSVLTLGSFADADALWQSKYANPETAAGGDAGSTKKWADEGSKDSKTSQEERWKTSGIPLNQTELGLKLQAAQRQAIAEAQSAINGMKNIPPLRLLVNPSQFSVKGAKIVSDGNWSRRGPIIEHWGDEQDAISASGRVAAFYTLETGVGRSARQFSESWRNLQSLYLLYKNNGGVYLSDPYDPAGRDKRLTYVGSIYIYYDGILYIGSFTNFNLTEDEGTPFTVEYSFEFQVRAAFLLDRPDDRYNIQYSYHNTNADQPKPPLPTKSAPSPSQTSNYATEQARLNEAIETSRRAREQAATQQQEDIMNSTLTSDGTLVITDGDGNVVRTVE